MPMIDVDKTYQDEDIEQLNADNIQPETDNDVIVDGGNFADDTQPIPPDGVVVASNGAWRDAETGQFVKGMPATDNAITSENTGDFQRVQRIRKWKAQLAAGVGLAEIKPAENELEAWAQMTKAMGEMALDKKGVASVRAYEAAGKATGFIGTNGKDGGSGPAPGRASVTVDLDQDALMEFITSRRQQDTSKQDIIPGDGSQMGQQLGQPSSSNQLRETPGQTDGDGAEEE